MTAPTQLLNSAEQEFRQHFFTAGANLVWNAAYQFRIQAAHYGEDGDWQWNTKEYKECLGDWQ